MNIKYRFSSSKSGLSIIIKVIDQLGYMFFRRNSVLPKQKYDSICFVNLAHIGDFILSLPTIYRVKLSNPSIRVSVAVLPQLKAFAEQFKFIDRVYSVCHPSYERFAKCKYRDLSGLKQIDDHIIFETRGDIRILLPLRLFCKTKHLVGFNSGGGGFLADKIIEYPHGEHAAKVYESILNYLNINPDMLTESFPLNELPVATFDIKYEKYIVAAPFAGASSRELSDEIFRDFIYSVHKETGLPVVFIGKTASRDRTTFYDFDGNSDFLNLINVTNMAQSCYVVKGASIFIGLESGFTHLASLMKKDIFAIYSAMTNIHNWCPVKNDNVIRYVYNDVECINCGRLVCEDNKCMKLFTADGLFIEFLQFYKRLR